MTAIAKMLLDIAVRIGKWLIRRLGKWLRQRVIGYMLGKVDDFKRRLARAKTARRKRWLRGRIDRWTRAVRWIERQLHTVLHDAAKSVCKLPEFKRLPEVARCERLVAA